jgi:hypothetical protein
MLQLFDQFSVALQDVEFNLDGTTVDFRLGDLAVDLSGLGTVAGEQARLLRRLENEIHAGNLGQIGMGLEDYTKAHGRLPPPALVGPDGKPLLSWRVALLPYVGQQELYQQFRLDQPWDSPHNKKLLDHMPRLYGRPGVPAPGAPAGALPGSNTVYRVFVGPGTAFEDPKGTPLSEIPDGVATTIAVVPADEQVPWTKPEELPFAPDRPLPSVAGITLLADGSVQVLLPAADEKARRALVTRNGGEKIDSARLLSLPDKGLLATNLNDASWEIGRPPHATPERYRWALRLAEEACALQPGNGNMLNTLGVAQYRAEHFPAALVTLTKSDQLNSAPPGKSMPADVAFLAMTHYRLGQTKQAQTMLQRLQGMMKEPARAADQESQGFLREAQTLIEGKSDTPKNAAKP